MPESNTLRRWPAYRRVPPFLPVPVRSRTDGWTAQRQGDFIGYLAQTGSVAEAARQVGMSRKAAYHLRKAPEAEGFAHAWDTVIGAWRGEEPVRRKVTHAELSGHAFDGPFVILMRRRKFIRAMRKPSNTALLRYVRRLDRMAGDWDERAL